jgi:hypothetical protein
LRAHQGPAHRDQREGPRAQPVQRQHEQEEQSVEGEDRYDRGAGQGQGGAQGHQDHGPDDHLGDGLAAGQAGLRCAAAGDESDREAGQDGEQGGRSALRQLHEEADDPALAGSGAYVDRVHAEDGQAAGQVQPADDGFAVGAEFGELVFVCCAKFLQSRTHPAVLDGVVLGSTSTRRLSTYSSVGE